MRVDCGLYPAYGYRPWQTALMAVKGFASQWWDSRLKTNRLQWNRFSYMHKVGRFDAFWRIEDGFLDHTWAHYWDWFSRPVTYNCADPELRSEFELIILVVWFRGRRRLWGWGGSGVGWGLGCRWGGVGWGLMLPAWETRSWWSRAAAVPSEWIIRAGNLETRTAIAQSSTVYVFLPSRPL